MHSSCSVDVVTPVFHVYACSIQVGRFGRKSSGSQKVLKGLNDEFTALTGQLIFECMTYDESSHPVTGVDALCNTVWGDEPRQAMATPRKFRFVLLITDGTSCCFSVPSES